jgi:hypothetical protein
VRADVAQRKLEAMGLRGLGAHYGACGSRGQGNVSDWAPSAVSPMATGARLVVSVGLRRRTAGRGLQDLALVRVAGVEPGSIGRASGITGFTNDWVAPDTGVLKEVRSRARSSR